ncbi:MAG: hypothetical protein RLZ98_2690 [Pseudomonadota bacterium]
MRRAGRLVEAAGVALSLLLATGPAIPAAAEPDPLRLLAEHPDDAITPTLVLSVVARVGETIEVGEGPDGVRRIVPILGGTFSGSGLRGVVLPGGADRQRIRADGVRELDAVYELRTDDGVILMVHNQVLVDAERPPKGQQRYARSVVRVTAPKGPYDWLNRRLLVGTLTSLRPAQPYVLLRFYAL